MFGALIIVILGLCAISTVQAACNVGQTSCLISSLPATPGYYMVVDPAHPEYLLNNGTRICSGGTVKPNPTTCNSQQGFYAFLTGHTDTPVSGLFSCIDGNFYALTSLNGCSNNPQYLCNANYVVPAGYTAISNSVNYNCASGSAIGTICTPSSSCAAGYVGTPAGFVICTQTGIDTNVWQGPGISNCFPSSSPPPATDGGCPGAVCTGWSDLPYAMYGSIGYIKTNTGSPISNDPTILCAGQHKVFSSCQTSGGYIGTASGRVSCLSANDMVNDIPIDGCFPDPSLHCDPYPIPNNLVAVDASVNDIVNTCGYSQIALDNGGAGIGSQCVATQCASGFAGSPSGQLICTKVGNTAQWVGVPLAGCESLSVPCTARTRDTFPGYTSCNSTASGSYCHYFCDTERGYFDSNGEAGGIDTLCFNGQWFNPVGCYDNTHSIGTSCLVPYTQTGFNLSTCTDVTDQALCNPNNNPFMSCAHGYVNTGITGNVVCDRGTWNGPLFGCTLPVCTLPLFQPGYTIVPSGICVAGASTGTTCKAVCAPGFQETANFVAGTTVSCTATGLANAIWVGAFSGCEPIPNLTSCQAVAQFGYTGGCPITISGEICTPTTCDSSLGYTGAAYNILQCVDGAWEGQFMGCTPPSCSNYTQPGYALCQSSVVSSLCVQTTCAIGYVGTPVGTITCSGSLHWNGLFTGCVGCQSFTAPAGYRDSTVNLPLGTVYAANCAQTASGTGVGHATCQNDGTWVTNVAFIGCTQNVYLPNNGSFLLANPAQTNAGLTVFVASSYSFGYFEVWALQGISNRQLLSSGTTATILYDHSIFGYNSSMFIIASSTERFMDNRETIHPTYLELVVLQQASTTVWQPAFRARYIPDVTTMPYVVTSIYQPKVRIFDNDPDTLIVYFTAESLQAIPASPPTTYASTIYYTVRCILPTLPSDVPFNYPAYTLTDCTVLTLNGTDPAQIAVGLSDRYTNYYPFQIQTPDAPYVASCDVLTKDQFGAQNQTLSPGGFSQSDYIISPSIDNPEGRGLVSFDNLVSDITPLGVVFNPYGGGCVNCYLFYYSATNTVGYVLNAQLCNYNFTVCNSIPPTIVLPFGNGNSATNDTFTHKWFTAVDVIDPTNLLTMVPLPFPLVPDPFIYTAACRDSFLGTVSAPASSESASSNVVGIIAVVVIIIPAIMGGVYYYYLHKQ